MSLVEKVNTGRLAGTPIHAEMTTDSPVEPVILTTPMIAVTAAAVQGATLGAGLAVAKNESYLGG